MPLSPGTRLGPYELHDLIGAGGMGEVYRARDTRLNRPVAVKVLPDVFTADPERVARFEQEARAAAALNHPNIVAVYDVGHHDRTSFIVSELLEGETLRDRVRAGPLPAQRAVDYAIQIADGLAAAHDKHIVHRDLKPENLFVTRDERVKILDFGLAKLRQAPISTEGTTMALPSDGAPATEAGRLLGTAGYMSPEQVRGEPADHRADIFALGAILYEVLGGRRAFVRDSAIETMAAILNEQPAELPALQSPAAGVLDRIVRRCLEKRPERRFESARDLAFALQTLGSAASVTAAPIPVRRPAIGHRAVVLAALVPIAAVAGWVLARTTATPSPSAPTRRVAIVLPPFEPVGLAEVAPLGDGRKAIAIAPDGSRIVYVANVGGLAHLVVRDLNRFETRRLPGTEGAFTPFFSPDGLSVAFYSRDALRRLSLAGGDPVAVCEARNPFGGVWLSDDTIVFGDKEGAQVVRVPASGGTPSVLLTGGLPWFMPTGALPGQRGVLMQVARSASPDYATIEALLFDGSERKTLIEGGTDPMYADGAIVFTRGGSLFAAPLDVERLEAGAASPMLHGIRTEISGTAQLAVADDGTLAYIEGSPMWIGAPVWVDRKGIEQPLGPPSQAYGQFRISPDGRRVAMTVVGATTDIWIHEVARGSFMRLTQDGTSALPTWMPDSRRLSYLTERGGQPAIVSRPVDGSGAEEPVLAEPAAPWSWSPDGGTLAFGCGSDLCVLAPATGGKPRPLMSTPFTEWGAAFSPDGRAIAYTSDASGRYEVYVRPFPDAGREWQVSIGGGEEPVWSPDGRELFYRFGFRWMRVPIRTVPELSADPPVLLFERPYMAVAGFSYDVSTDGLRLLVVKGPEEPRVTTANIVFNWFEELRQTLGR